MFSSVLPEHAGSKRGSPFNRGSGSDTRRSWRSSLCSGGEDGLRKRGPWWKTASHAGENPAATRNISGYRAFSEMKDASEHRLRIISGSRPVANSRSKDDQGVTKKNSRLARVVVEVVNCNRPVLAPTGTSALT